MTQKDILQKIATSDFTGGGLLNAEQANKFITNVVDESTFLKYARTIKMNAPTMEIPKLILIGRVARAWTEGSSVAPVTSIGTDKIELSAKKIMVDFSLTYDLLEDNVEKEKLADTIMKEVAAQFANDLEELAINGDTSNTTDSYLALMDWIKKICQSWGTHAVTYTSSEKLSKKVFSDLLRALPTKYRRNRSQLVYFVWANAEQDYRDSLTDRNTNLGDNVLTTNQNLRIFGIEIVPVPFLDDKWAILMPKQNFVVGIYRQIMMEKQKDIRTQEIFYVLSTRVAMAVQEKDAIAYTSTLDY